MHISVIGSGYVGIVSGLCLAEKGHNVICFDQNKKIVDKINNSSPHFYEPGLKKLLKKNLTNKRFKAELVDNNTIFNTEVIIVAVGTPTKSTNIDLSQIKKASIQIAKSIRNQ